MATEFHLQVRNVLAAAIQRRTTERQLFIDQVVGGDTSMAREVRSLLPHYLKVAGLDLGVSGTQLSAAAPHFPPDAPAAGHDDEWQPPFSIAPYQVVEVIGRGGMGVVYKGKHPTRPQVVAIKILRRRLVERGLIRFKQEEAFLRRLQHPGIVRFHYSGEVAMRWAPNCSGEDRRPYFVMEFIQGQPLVRHASAAKLDAVQRIALLARICEAAEYAHHRGVIHCDLKPDNILVNAAGQPKILDFGIARLEQFGTQLVRDSRHFIGTLAYASPEQRAARTAALSAESDVYSLGLIMHELLTGRLPRRVGTRLVLDVANLSRAGVPGADSDAEQEFQHVCRGILANALRGTRGRRYATAGQFAADLGEVHELFSPRTGSRLGSWLSAFHRDTPGSSAAHNRLLRTLLRTRVSMGLEM